MQLFDIAIDGESISGNKLVCQEILARDIGKKCGMRRPMAAEGIGMSGKWGKVRGYPVAGLVVFDISEIYM